MPIFNQDEQPIRQAVSNSQTETLNSNQPVLNAQPVEKPAPVKVIRRVGNLFSPSIKDALAGNTSDKKTDSENQEKAYNEYENFSDSFSNEQLTVKWNEFLLQISDRPNLRSALSNIPEITDENKLLLKIGNSVQEEDVRLIKPELTHWLRKELRNSTIEILTRMEKVESDRVFYSDTEKLQLMIQKNPDLLELKQKFNLDFKD